MVSNTILCIIVRKEVKIDYILYVLLAQTGRDTQNIKNKQGAVNNGVKMRTDHTLQ